MIAYSINGSLLGSAKTVNCTTAFFKLIKEYSNAYLTDGEANIL